MPNNTTNAVAHCTPLHVTVDLGGARTGSATCDRSGSAARVGPGTVSVRLTSRQFPAPVMRACHAVFVPASHVAFPGPVVRLHPVTVACADSSRGPHDA